MKKILFALPLVAGASWAGTTLYSSNQTQDAYHNLITQLGQMTTFQLESESYTAGFMQSSAVTAIKASNAADAPVLFRLQHDIHHSPIGNGPNGTQFGAATIVTRLLSDSLEDSAQRILAAFDNGEPFEMHSQIEFSGLSNHQFIINSARYDTDNGEGVFDGGQMDFSYTENGKLSGQSQLGEYTFTTSSGGVTIEKSHGEFDLDWISNGLFAGNYSYAFDGISAKDSNMGMDVGARDITLTSTSKLDGNEFSGGGKLAIGSIDAPVPVSSIIVDVSMDKVGMAGLAAYTRLSNSALFIEPEDADAFVAGVLESMKGMILPGSKLTYRVNVGNDGGNIEAAAGVEFVGDGSATGYENIATNGDLLRALSATATLNADVDALNMTPAAMFLMDPQLENYVLNDGVHYTSNLQLSDLVVHINDNPMSLELMMGEMLDMPLDLSMLP